MNKELVYFQFTGVSSTKHVRCAEEINQNALKYLAQVPDRQRLIDVSRYRIKAAIFRESCESNPEMVIEAIIWIKNKKIVVWGAGIWGRRVIRILSECGLKIDYLVDSNQKMEGTFLKNVKIKNPCTLKGSKSYVIIAVQRINQDIEKQLGQFGVERERYIFLEEWMTILTKETEIYQRQNMEDGEVE